MKSFNKFFNFFMAFLLVFNLSFSSVFADDTPKQKNSANDIEIEVKDTETLTTGETKLQIEILGISDSDSNQVSFWQKVLSEYREIIAMVSGIAALTFIVFFIISFLKLGKAASNPQERQAAISGIIMTGIASAFCGGVSIFIGFFYNLLA